MPLQVVKVRSPVIMVGLWAIKVSSQVSKLGQKKIDVSRLKYRSEIREHRKCVFNEPPTQ